MWKQQAKEFAEKEESNIERATHMVQHADSYSSVFATLILQQIGYLSL